MMKKIIFCGLCFFSLAALGWGAPEGPTPATNTDFLLGMLKTELGQATGTANAPGLNAVKEKNLYLHSSRPHPADWLVEYAAVDVFGAMQIRVFKELNQPAPQNASVTAKNDTTSAESTKTADTLSAKPAQKDTGAVIQPARPYQTKDGFILEYRLLDCYIVYDKTWRQGFFGPKQLQRSGAIDLVMQVCDAATGAVVWQKKIAARATEVLPYASKAFIENSAYDFLKANAAQPYWKEFLEITLAGGSVGYILYLFFSQSFN
jgi:hypothetical protein